MKIQTMPSYVVPPPTAASKIGPLRAPWTSAVNVLGGSPSEV